MLVQKIRAKLIKKEINPLKKRICLKAIKNKNYLVLKSLMINNKIQYIWSKIFSMKYYQCIINNLLRKNKKIQKEKEKKYSELNNTLILENFIIQVCSDIGILIYKFINYKFILKKV